jgi:hypothetical protein
MRSSGLTITFLALFLPVLSNAQDVYRSTRSFEEQQAISHISQAEYYIRMALKSLDASQKIGKAPYFNYQIAREDIEKILAEFRTYLGGDESTDLPPAVPLVIDGRYFVESIRDFLAIRKTDEKQAATKVQGKNGDGRAAAAKAATKKGEPEKKRNVPEPGNLRQDSAMTFSPPARTPESSRTKRDKIEEILMKGL